MAKRTPAETAVALTPAEEVFPEVEAQNQQLALYLNGQSYNEERLIQEVEFFHQQHMHSAFEVGRRLIALKAAIPYGHFGTAVLERVGIGASHASHLMAFARRVVELSDPSKGLEDTDKLKTMDPRKLAMLNSVAESDPEELEATGKIGGRTLDEWDGMSRKELLAEVRKHQDGVEMRRVQLEKVNKELVDQIRINKQITASTPNAVTESITRLGKHLRDALTDFSRTAVYDGDLPEATAHDMRSMKAELRQFYHRINEIMENRFPDIAEVPSDIDLGEFPIMGDEEEEPKKPARKSAKVVDAN